MADPKDAILDDLLDAEKKLQALANDVLLGAPSPWAMVRDLALSGAAGLTIGLLVALGTTWPQTRKGEERKP